MYARWLVATDFDVPAQAAAEAAAGLAARCATADRPALVVLTHIVQSTPMVITPDVMGLPDVAAQLAAAREDAGAQLEEQARALRVRHPTVRIETRNVAGPVVTALLDEADRQNVDAIAIGSRGKGVVARVVLGSISDAAVHHSTKPVLVVKVEAPKGIAVTP
jgi:nucleotide-binding universal stress UspA family protein